MAGGAMGMLLLLVSLGMCMQMTEDINLAIEIKKSGVVLDTAPLLYTTKSADTDCHYDDVQSCSEHNPSVIIKTFSYNKMGGHTDGTHVHYNNPDNIHYGMRVRNPPAKSLPGEYDLEMTKNGHYDNKSPLDRRFVGDSDESSEYTREERPGSEAPRVKEQYDIHKYGTNKGRSPNVFMMYLNRFEGPGE